MAIIDPKLEALFDKVRALPEEKQRLAVEALTEIADEPYQLSEAERAILFPALERMQRGEFADEQAVNSLLDEPWR